MSRPDPAAVPVEARRVRAWEAFKREYYALDGCLSLQASLNAALDAYDQASALTKEEQRQLAHVTTYSERHRTVAVPVYVHLRWALAIIARLSRGEGR